MVELKPSGSQNYALKLITKTATTPLEATLYETNYYRRSCVRVDNLQREVRSGVCAKPN